MSNLNTLPKILIILGILVIPSIAYLIVSSGENNYAPLEIYGPREPGHPNPADTVFHTIGSFTLIDQSGQTFDRQKLKNKIYVADFFFATCQTICPKMNMQMRRVQEAYNDDPNILLVSHTVNPAQDSVSVLRAYADEYDAINGKWFFLTGDKKVIYDLARNDYFITAMDGDGGPHDFIHSEQLVLVDYLGQIRGFYDGTDYEDVNLLIDDIKVLKWEQNNKLKIQDH